MHCHVGPSTLLACFKASGRGLVHHWSLYEMAFAGQVHYFAEVDNNRHVKPFPQAANKDEATTWFSDLADLFNTSLLPLEG